MRSQQLSEKTVPLIGYLRINYSIYKWRVEQLHVLTRRKALFLIAIALLSVLISSSCQVEQEGGFGIYLTDSGELVLSEHHIKAFHSTNNTLELNENGIEKWNSYLTYQTIPKLADSLFSWDFVLKIEGREIGRGKFWSNASSSSVGRPKCRFSTRAEGDARRAGEPHGFRKYLPLLH